MAGIQANVRRFCAKYLTKIQFLVILVLVYRTYVLENQTVHTNSDQAKMTDSTIRSNATEPKADVNVNVNGNVNNVYKERIERVKDLCASYVHETTWRKHVPRGAVWSFGGRTGINYCIVPKVGCTYWKRIFRFISKDYPKNKAVKVTRPSDIDRNFVHYGPVKNISTSTMADRFFMQMLSGSNLFMFVRDPYSRLWSAYIDKFLLPDFWRYFAKRSMSDVRPNATQSEINCPKNLTFVEFLTHVVKSNASGNEHWAPIHRMCSPCHVQYDVIGKQETFSQDSKFILNRYGLGDLIETESLDSRVEQETSMLIEYNFALETKISKSCFKKLEIAERLWKAFQYNGYVHKLTPFPSLVLDNPAFYSNPTMELSNVLSDVLRDQKFRGATLKTQKRDFMVEAYANVPEHTIERLQDIYRHDFELFDYEVEPEYLFGHSHENSSFRTVL